MYISDSLDGNYRQLSINVFQTTAIRHVALDVSGGKLHVYYSQTGDAPERIYRSFLTVEGAAEDWIAEGKEVVIEPEAAWEGSNLPLAPSRGGPAWGPENALRDPAIFLWDNRTFLLYSAAAESSIGIAEIVA